MPTEPWHQAAALLALREGAVQKVCSSSSTARFQRRKQLGCLLVAVAAVSPATWQSPTDAGNAMREPPCLATTGGGSRMPITLALESLAQSISELGRQSQIMVLSVLRARASRGTIALPSREQIETSSTAAASRIPSPRHRRALIRRRRLVPMRLKPDRSRSGRQSRCTPAAGVEYQDPLAQLCVLVLNKCNVRSARANMSSNSSTGSTDRRPFHADKRPPAAQSLKDHLKISAAAGTHTVD